MGAKRDNWVHGDCMISCFWYTHENEEFEVIIPSNFEILVV